MASLPPGMRPQVPAIDVLVVDDDEAIAQFVVTLLEDRGYRVHVAHNGRQAMEVLSHTRPRVLLLDLMLPIVNGWELARTMRATPALEDVPIIVMSAHSDGADEALEVGAAGYLSKPFDLDELFSCVATYVGSRE